MPLVKAPNGDVSDLPEATASGLVNSDGAGWEYAEKTEPKPVKRAARKPDSFEKK